MDATPVPIYITIDGRLLDGQHRLASIIESDTTQLLYVARDCDPEILQVIDTGRPRRAADALAIEGVDSVNNVVSFIRLLLAYEQGAIPTIPYARSHSPTPISSPITGKTI